MRKMAGAVLVALALVAVGGPAEARSSKTPGCKTLAVASQVETFPGLSAPGLPDSQGIEVTTTTTTLKCRGQVTTSVVRTYRYV